MADTTGKQVIVAQNLEEALAALTNMGLSAIPVAGGTWVMRAPVRQEATAQSFVSLHAIEELKGIEATWLRSEAISAALTSCHLTWSLR